MNTREGRAAFLARLSLAIAILALLVGCDRQGLLFLFSWLCLKQVGNGIKNRRSAAVHDVPARRSEASAADRAIYPALERQIGHDGVFAG